MSQYVKLRWIRSAAEVRLESNLQALHDIIRSGSWRPQPSREVLIPKPQGGTRPLAIGRLEDKIVPKLTARILEAIYEPLFYRHSYGFRQGKSCIKSLFKWLTRRSQKRSFSWAKFNQKLWFNPLPEPPRGESLIDLTSEHHSERKHQPKSRMREIRTSGSERSLNWSIGRLSFTL